jgi:rod shape-determining protein MreD
VRRGVLWTAVIITSLLLQSTVFAQVRLLDAKPELMYLVTVAMAVLEGPTSGAVTGFAGGMAQDFLLDQPKGITALTLTLLGYVVGMLRQYIVTPSALLPVILVAGGTAGGVLFNGLVKYLLGQLQVEFVFLVRVALLSALYNAVLTPILFPVLRRVVETSRAKRVFRW